MYDMEFDIDSNIICIADDELYKYKVADQNKYPTLRVFVIYLYSI